MKSSISSSLRLKLKKIFLITIGWLVTTLFIIFFDRITLATYGYAPQVDFYQNASVSIFAAVLAGLIGGAFLVFLLEDWLRRMPFWQVTVTVTWWFSVVFVGISIISGLLYFSILLDRTPFDKIVWQSIWGFICSAGFIKGYASWGLINMLTIFVLQVSDKYGPIIFGDFLLGKYFRPTREERIFMFLDIRSSTTIAEKLGEVKYFNLVNDFIKDCTESILASRGQIYQYVGDEIVVTWKVKKGAENANCLRCFFNIQNVIEEHAAYYLEAYGVVPEFKAGLHYGFVMAGEIGLVKKEIAFSGDVLNTTARIQSMCNGLGVDLLISKYLLDRLPQAIPFIQNAQPMGDISLRGKRKKVMLYTLTK